MNTLRVLSFSVHSRYLIGIFDEPEIPEYNDGKKGRRSESTTDGLENHVKPERVSGL